MNSDQANALLATLRSKNDINQLTLGNYAMWPLFRLAVLYHVIKATQKGAQRGRGQAGSFVPSSVPAAASADLDGAAAPAPAAGTPSIAATSDPGPKPVRPMRAINLGDAAGFDLPEPGMDILLVQSFRDFANRRDGRPIDRLAEGLLSTFGAGDGIRVEAVSLPGAASLASAQRNLGFVQPIDRTPSWDDRDVAAFVARTRALSLQVRKRTKLQIVRPIDCLSWAMRIIGLVPGWRAVLEHLRPKAVMVQAYTNLEKMALCAAARELGIPVIDHQHGMFTRSAEMYLSWPKPREGIIDPTPSVFWVWSDWFGERMPVPTKGVRAIVGGDLRAREDRAGEADGLAVTHGTANARTVLYLHQPFGEGNDAGAVPSRIAKAIARSPANWRWLIRLHPRALFMADAVGAAIDAALAQAKRSGPPPDVSIMEPSTASLDACVEAADVVLTGSSAAAFDAIDAGVPVVFADGVMNDRLSDGAPVGPANREEADEDARESEAHMPYAIVPDGDLLEPLSHMRKGPARSIFLLRDPDLARAAVRELIGG